MELLQLVPAQVQRDLILIPTETLMEEMVEMQAQ
jgi:hypothetical protein